MGLYFLIIYKKYNFYDILLLKKYSKIRRTFERYTGKAGWICMTMLNKDESKKTYGEKSKRKHDKMVSAHDRLKKHPRYQIWSSRLINLVIVSYILAALGFAILVISLVYGYFHPDKDHLAAEDAVICQGKIKKITNESYISKFGAEHICYDFQLDNGQTLELENELYLIFLTYLDGEYQDENEDHYVEDITNWIDKLQTGDCLSYAVRKNEQDEKWPTIYSLAVNGEPLISIDEVNAMKYEVNRNFKEYGGVLLFAILVFWLICYWAVTDLIKEQRSKKKMTAQCDQEFV